MSDAPLQTVPAVRPVPETDDRSAGTPRGRRVTSGRPGPVGLRLRFAERERTDLPEVRLESGQVTLIEGHAGVEAIRHRLVLDCAARGRSVVHVVGGNRLDSTGLARRAQALGLDPGYVLRASVVARAFTAYQLSVLVEERLPAHLAESEAPALAVVSDPLTLYADEDVRRQEGRRLAEQALSSLVRTARRRGCPVLVVQPPRPWARGRPAPGSPRGHRADEALVQLVRAHATQHVRIHELDRGHAGGPDRVIELPEQGERHRIADPRAEQARLDRFHDPGGPSGG